MKIKDIEIRSNVTAMIPKENLKQTTRVKVVLNQTAYEKGMEKFRSDIEETLKRIKPEGFDDKFKKFQLTTKIASEMTEEELNLADELRKDAEYAAFKDALDKVESDYAEAQKKIIDENDYAVNERKYTDDELADIASVLPEGGKTVVRLQGKETPVSNGEILHLVMYHLA